MLEKGALFVVFIKIIRRLAKSIILKDIIIKQNTGKVEKNIMLLGIERESITLTNMPWELSLQHFEAQNLEDAWIDFITKYIYSALLKASFSNNKNN